MTGEPFKKMMRPSNPRPSHEQASTRFPKWR
jgi:hypothetical protein